VLTGSVKGLDVTSRLIESGPFDLPSRWSKGQRGVSTARIPSSTITGRNTANVLPHLVWLLRQARGWYGPIRSTPDPHRGINLIKCVTHSVHKRKKGLALGTVTQLDKIW